MDKFASDIAFTPTIKKLQSLNGSRDGYARMEAKGGWNTTVTKELGEFLADSDMFYFGTSNENGQPYIQYRGGPKGFLKVIDDSTLGFADFGGNKQFISTGNLQDNPRAFIFLMDYENRRRIKIWGRAKAVSPDPHLVSTLADPEYPAIVERAILFEIGAWDANCPQHIHQRIRKEKIESQINVLKERIEILEAKLANSRQL